MREKPELHTDLTTTAAITLHRSIVGKIIRIFVKVSVRLRAEYLRVERLRAERLRAERLPAERG